MNRPLRYLLLALLFVLIVGLAGCSSDPSEDDAKRGLASMVSQAMLGVPVEIRNVEMGDCASDSTVAGVACSLSAIASVPLTETRREEVAVSGIFVFDKIGGEWKLVGRKQ